MEFGVVGVYFIFFFLCGGGGGMTTIYSLPLIIV